MGICFFQNDEWDQVPRDDKKDVYSNVTTTKGMWEHVEGNDKENRQGAKTVNIFAVMKISTNFWVQGGIASE